MDRGPDAVEGGGEVSHRVLLKSLMGQENCESGGHEKAHWGLDSGCWHSLVNS